MAEQNIKNMVGKVFSDIADAVETGQFGSRTRVGITTLGSELGVDNIIEGAEIAQERDPSIEVVLIGPESDSELTQVVVKDEDEGYAKMEELLDSGDISSCVTMHYNFPIGVSTVGRVVTPGKGKEMFIATTTGTSSPHRVEAMILNGINGIITAKSMGIENPTVGILNVDGARQVERAFKDLNSNGYEINFAESMRADGGTVMRGNDLLVGTPDVMVTDTLTGNILMKMFSSYTTGGSYEINFAESMRADGGTVMRGNDLLVGTPDVMVTDTLTGNILMKMFSSYTTGGSYEAQGFGYGPGVGSDYDRTVLILSRASGSPVVANALSYGAGVANGDINAITTAEFEKANKAGLKDILEELTQAAKKSSSDDEEEVTAPPEEIVTGTVSGIDILDLEDAVKVLWKEEIYAESGMGCTGPIIMVSEENLEKAIEILTEADYVTGE